MLSDVFTTQVAAHFLASRHQDRVAVVGLGRCLDALASAEDLSGRLDPWVALLDWVRAVPSAVDQAGMLTGPALARWHMLFDFLQATPAAQVAPRTAMAEVLRESEGARIGRNRMVKLAGTVSRNIAGWGTNVSLGLMLGLTPVVGAFLGLPLDVRHVTLNTGTLSLATAAMAERWYGGFLLWAAAGIGTMFVLNLSVSFLLSLYTAARAFGLPRTFVLEFALALGRRLLRRPGDFVLPPRD